MFNGTVTALMLREIKSFLHLLFGKRVFLSLPATPHWIPGLYPDKEMVGNVCTPKRPLLQFVLEIHSHGSALGGPFLTEVPQTRKQIVFCPEKCSPSLILPTNGH